jgi:biotin operon repressor
MLAIHANTETGYCYVKESTLANETGYKRPTISVHIQQLRNEGWIDFRAQTSKNGYRINHEYLLLFRDDLTWPDGTAPRVNATNTEHARPRVREDYMAASYSRTSPCHSNEHAVPGKQTRRVGDDDGISKQFNIPIDKQTANKSLEQGDSALDSLSVVVKDEGEGSEDQLSTTHKGIIRRGVPKPSIQSSAKQSQKVGASKDTPPAKETPMQRMDRSHGDQS